MIELKTSLSDYTQDEFRALLDEICAAQGSNDYQDRLLEHFILVTQYPLGSDLIYYPEQGDGSPADVIRQIIQWRTERGLSAFKNTC